MIKIFYIALGGALGAISRFGIAHLLKGFSDSIKFPAGTLLANLFGCFLIGFLMQLAVTEKVFSPDVEAMIFAGFIGSLTTFSTFSLETVELFKTGARLTAGAYLAFSLGLGISFLLIGSSIAETIRAK